MPCPAAPSERPRCQAAAATKCLGEAQRCPNPAVTRTDLGIPICAEHYREWFGRDWEEPLDITDAWSDIERKADRMQKGEGHE